MIAGLVLAGGESRRMGHDKALITLGDKPAYLYMADLLLPFCDEVYVSCREDQQLTFGENPKVVGLFDQPAHAGRGPMSGILSYLNHCSDNQSQFSDNQSIAPTNGLLLLGCDYRKMTEETLGRLVAVGQTQGRICCYQNHITGFIEPLVAYYPAEILQQVPEFAKENSSLRQFVEAHNPCILPTDIQTLQTLRSFDQ
ncbi:MAG: molybdenum cofactor guanylyltransferase [Bacteroidia bacterium]